MYSQNNEDDLILDYFGDKKGVLLDIGANDGQTLSNSRAFIELGWEADLVEPSPAAFAKLRECPITLFEPSGDPFTAVYGVVENIGLYNFAIGTETGLITLYESDWHLTGEDVALLSTAKPEELNRWRNHLKPDGTPQVFMEVQVKAYTWADSSLSRQKYSYITIDAEGLDWEILKQIDLSHTDALCIEWNGDEAMKSKILAYTAGFDLKIAHSNAENIIFLR